jgi:hypothetical protein
MEKSQMEYEARAEALRLADRDEPVERVVQRAEAYAKFLMTTPTKNDD